MLKGIPIEDTAVSCEFAQKVNHDIIVNHIHPEDGNVEAAVIAHTLLCDVCKRKFLEEEKNVESLNGGHNGLEEG
jgi:hypothetical protein